MDSVQPDLELETIKAGSRQTWIDGDYGKIAKSIESAAVEFVARRNIAPGMRVLDVACGNGNAPARRFIGQRTSPPGLAYDDRFSLRMLPFRDPLRALASVLS